MRTKSNRGRPLASAKYPWDRWMNGRKHTLSLGTHFKCSVRSMIVYLYQVAHRRKLGIRIIDLGEQRLSIQAHNGTPIKRRTPRSR